MFFPHAGFAAFGRVRLTANVRGALWMVGSAVFFTAMTALVKHLSGYSPVLLLFFSQLAVLIVLLPAIVRTPHVLALHQFKLLFARALTTVGGALLSYYAFQELPLADANALSFTRALWMAPLAAIVLGERVSLLRAAALVVGFAGVLLVANPAGETAVGWAHGAAIGSALLLALSVVSIKVLGRDHGTFGLLCWGSLLGFLLSIPPAILTWKWPGAVDLALLVGIGAAGVGAQVCYIKGMTQGDAAALAPIDYLRLVFAVAVGAAFFGELPTLWTLAGGILIVASTLSLTVWEAVQHRRRVPADA